MAGEMHASEVTAEAYPLHFAVAEHYNGEVLPFDQYQGPYVFISGKGRVWLCTDTEGEIGYWYSEKLEAKSPEFLLYYRDEQDQLVMAVSAAIELLG